MTSQCPLGFCQTLIKVFREKRGFSLYIPKASTVPTMYFQDITLLEQDGRNRTTVLYQFKHGGKKRPQETSFLVKSIFSPTHSHWYGSSPPFFLLSLLKGYFVFIYFNVVTVPGTVSPSDTTSRQVWTCPGMSVC